LCELEADLAAANHQKTLRQEIDIHLGAIGEVEHLRRTQEAYQETDSAPCRLRQRVLQHAIGPRYRIERQRAFPFTGWLPDHQLIEPTWNPEAKTLKKKNKKKA
jgi:hypothetical protein